MKAEFWRSRFKRLLPNKKQCVHGFLSFYLVASMILMTVSFLSTSSQTADAAALNIEVLTNMQARNDSQTTAANRWKPSEAARRVTFTVTGQEPIQASLELTGKKYGVTVIPEELVGRVTTDGEATIHTNVTIDMKRVGVLSTVLTTLDQLVAGVLRVLSGDNGQINLAVVDVEVAEFQRQARIFQNLSSLGEATFTSPVSLINNDRVLTTSIDDGAGPVVATNISRALADLQAGVDSIRVSSRTPVLGPAAVLLINGILNPLKNALNIAIQAARAAISAGGAIIGQLADASLLGGTTITMPTNVRAPANLTNDLDARFVSTIVRTNLIDVALLSQADARSTIYFEGAKFEMNNTKLPGNLNFGTHTIQTLADERFTALDDRSSPQAGTIELTDTRPRQKNWQVKVAQSTHWLNRSTSLGSAQLLIYGGSLSSNFTDGQLTGISNRSIALTPNTQQPVMRLQNASSSGTASLEIQRFELFVPKNTEKREGQYETTLIWTVTDSP